MSDSNSIWWEISNFLVAVPARHKNCDDGKIRSLFGVYERPLGTLGGLFSVKTKNWFHVTNNHVEKSV